MSRSSWRSTACKNVVANAPEASKDGGRNLAYALYVLAKNGVAPLGDLRYLADSQAGRSGAHRSPRRRSPQRSACWVIARGPRRSIRRRSNDLKPPTAAELVSRSDYGSVLRDSAALVTLASETGGSRPMIATALQRVEQARSFATYTSTQENAWMVLAARAMCEGRG